jgi:hypothetical protein
VASVHIFQDVVSLSPGTNWKNEIIEAIDKSDMVFVIVGKNWVGEMALETRRIDSIHDFVRFEVEYSLAKGKNIVPIVLDYADFTFLKLPESLAPITNLAAFRISHEVKIEGIRELLLRMRVRFR